MQRSPCRILFLCTGNSAGSILAACLANRLGEGRVRAWSAGSHPKGEVQAHWSIEDPAAAEGEPSERHRAFERVYRELERRIEPLVRLPIASLDRDALRSCIGRLAETDEARRESR